MATKTTDIPDSVNLPGQLADIEKKIKELQAARNRIEIEITMCMQGRAAVERAIQERKKTHLVGEAR